MKLRLLDVAKTIGFMLVAIVAHPCVGQHRPFAPVPPSMEIEVLDPGVDSNGNPAVVLKDDGTVDIPPVVLVHRYYYSGDRSFQGPMLPGGPSILVLNHPKNGERVYVSAQMMPGAPRITYTKKGITYQYPNHAIMLRFGVLGVPKIEYRSGLSLTQKVAKTVHAEHVADHVKKGVDKSKRLAARGKTAAVGVTASVVQGTKTITLPVTNLLQIMPLGKKLFGGDLEVRLAENAAIFKRDLANKHAQKRAKLDDLTIPTNR